MPINITGTMMNVINAMTAANTKRTNKQLKADATARAKENTNTLEELKNMASLAAGQSTYLTDINENLEVLKDNMYDENHNPILQGLVYNQDKMMEATEGLTQFLSTKKNQNYLRKEYKKQGGKI